eukprot:symbB.v1.2.009577.t1/scaffold609.1/size185969/7
MAEPPSKKRKLTSEWFLKQLQDLELDEDLKKSAADCLAKYPEDVLRKSSLDTLSFYLADAIGDENRRLVVGCMHHRIKEDGSAPAPVVPEQDPPDPLCQWLDETVERTPKPSEWKADEVKKFSNNILGDETMQDKLIVFQSLVLERLTGKGNERCSLQCKPLALKGQDEQTSVPNQKFEMQTHATKLKCKLTLGCVGLYCPLSETFPAADFFFATNTGSVLWLLQMTKNEDKHDCKIGKMREEFEKHFDKASLEKVSTIKWVIVAPEVIASNYKKPQTVHGEWKIGSKAVEVCLNKCFHQHTWPFQLQQTPAGNDPYFKAGDWHDTYQNVLDSKATVRFSTVDFHGTEVVHCHALSHSDQGMIGAEIVSGRGKEACACDLLGEAKVVDLYGDERSQRLMTVFGVMFVLMMILAVAVAGQVAKASFRHCGESRYVTLAPGP